MIERGHHAPMQVSALDPIDTHEFGYLSYPPPVGGRLGMEEPWVSVEPEVGDRSVEQMPRIARGFPLRPGKVQRPFLPNETLRRDRLLDWLHARADCRVIFVAAGAGFGKTTLVADYLRRSRIRTFWYQLDDDDTDGLVFMRYLVAACQAVDPQLLARSAALLEESSLEPPSEEAVLRALLAEVDCLGEVPSALVLDDFHVVEGRPAIGAVVERLIARAPAGLRLILASRRPLGLSAAALRVRGQLAELGREELRFEEAETDRLFRETYRRPLEPDVLRELQARTEGWIASLRLVKTALDRRSPVQARAFIQSLSGAEGDVYDYLAEEVLGELDSKIRAFLMRVAVLEEIGVDMAAVAAETSPARASQLLRDAERLGLLSKGVGIVTSWRLHPLVCDFLLAHLEAEMGRPGVVDLHRRLASAFEAQSWRLAARHWAAAVDADQVRRVICGAVPTIIGAGDFAAADAFMRRFPDPNPNAWYDILLTRQLTAQGRYDEAAALADRSSHVDSQFLEANPAFAPARALTRLHVGIQRDNREMRVSAAEQLSRSGDEELESIARSAELLCDASDSGSLDALCGNLQETARLNRQRGHTRHEGISLLNLSIAEFARGNHEAAVQSGVAATALLRVGSNSGDLAASLLNTAKGLAHLGRWAEALACVDEALGDATKWVEPETIAEAAELQAMYGDPAQGFLIMHELAARPLAQPERPYCTQVNSRLDNSAGFPGRAIDHLNPIGLCPVSPGFSSAVQSLRIHVRASMQPQNSSLVDELANALRFAEGQQAWFWCKTIRLTQALISPSHELSGYVRALKPADAGYLAIQAELVVRRLADLNQAALEIVKEETTRRPVRWRWALRQLLASETARPLDIKRAIDLLEMVGDQDDVVPLRKLAHNKGLKIQDAGRTLMKRLAPPAFVDDLGRVTIRIGDRVVSGTDVRKKVLSLLIYLLTRPQFTASREQVIEALWPHMEPEAGANSLNQTSYFLRQVFEPKAEEDATSGYLNSRADLIWLDPELVQSRSAKCLALIATIRRNPSPELVTRLAELYTGRFAVDFMYDWASSFRENLHAGVLDRVERSIVDDTKIGAFDRALAIAQMALQADPDAEQIELCLLRLYRRMGAHAAAEEQYAHYAAVMREQLGVEPPALETI